MIGTSFRPAATVSPRRRARWRLVVGASLAATVAACGPAPDARPEVGPVPAAPGLDLTRVDVVDLSHAYDETTLFWPTSPTGFELTTLASGTAAGGYFYRAHAFAMPEHGGTHLDAPVHFFEQGWTLGQVPIERLVAPGVVIDVSAAAAANADYRLTVEDVTAWEATRGQVPEGAIVLLQTGWGRRWPDAGAYLGDDTPGDATHLHFPGYGAAAARLLVEERRVAAIGIDTASIDHGPSTDFGVHRIAAAANVVALENVANVGAVPPVGAWIVALPIKIRDGSGGPVRAIALVPR